MSTRDFLSAISDAYKSSLGGRNGHSLPMLAECVSGNITVWNTILPDCGPLVVVNEDETNPNSGFTVTLNYESAYLAYWATGFTYDMAYYFPVYTGAITGSATLTFASGLRADTQQVVTGMIHRVTAMSVSPLNNVSVYCLGDNGVRILHSDNTEKERQAIHNLQLGNYAAQSTCFRCTGEKVYSGVVCPDCSGYGYVGFNAEKYILYKQGESWGVKRVDENDESLSMRIWAKRYQMIPTRNNVKSYISQFTMVPTGYIELYENYHPECFFRIKYPANMAGDKYPNLQELVDNICPLGVNAIVEPFWYVWTSGTQGDLEKPLQSGMYHAYARYIAADPTAWECDWDNDWYGDAIKYFNADGSISGICYSGDQLIVNTGYFSGITWSGFLTILETDQVF